MSDSIEFTINIMDEAIKDILIARLAEAGVSGFEEQRKLLKAFATKGEVDEEVLNKIIEEQNVSFYKSIIKEKNWNSIWESDFQPIMVETFCSVRAHFHPANALVRHEIIITPKMSFGTGHHATTYLMIQAMQHLDFKHKNVFDFGTGTGILAILAEKCGAKRVLAIDNDDWSINNATENFNVNNCHNILITKDEEMSEKEQYDIILANINRNVILQNLEKIQQHLVTNGVVLLSGLLQGDEQVIATAAARCGFSLNQTTEREGWLCLSMVNA